MQIESLRQYWRFFVSQGWQVPQARVGILGGAPHGIRWCGGWGLGIIDRQTSILREEALESRRARGHTVRLIVRLLEVKACVKVHGTLKCWLGY